MFRMTSILSLSVFLLILNFRNTYLIVKCTFDSRETKTVSGRSLVVSSLIVVCFFSLLEKRGLSFRIVV